MLAIRAPRSFVHNYSLQAMFKAGFSDLAVAQLRSRFERMMAASDSPIIWETWDTLTVGDWAETHSGSTGPAWTLSQYVLGVGPQGPGFQRCRIEPQAGGLSWARGVVPTFRGDVSVDRRRGDKDLTLNIEVPAGLETDVILPCPASKDLQLKYESQRIDIPAAAREARGMRLDENSVILQVTGGKHE
jgi:hypothetical protein